MTRLRESLFNAALLPVALVIGVAVMTFVIYWRAASALALWWEARG